MSLIAAHNLVKCFCRLRINSVNIAASTPNLSQQRSVSFLSHHEDSSQRRQQCFQADFQHNRSFGSLVNSMSAMQLWHGMKGVSNPGRKRGRLSMTKGRLVFNINARRPIGISGKKTLAWFKHGTSTPKQQHKGKSNSTSVQNIDRTNVIYEQTGDVGARLFDESKRIKTMQRRSKVSDGADDRLAKDPYGRVPQAVRSVRYVSPMIRGWTSPSMCGVVRDGPMPCLGEDFSNFRSIIIQLKTVSHMEAVLGRVISWSCAVAIGNGNGMVGVNFSKASKTIAAFDVALKRASKRLHEVPLRVGGDGGIHRTLHHDFIERESRTIVHACAMPPGTGLSCIRPLTAICQLVGLTDCTVTVRGSKNTRNAIIAFMRGLYNQKTLQDIADEYGHDIYDINKRIPRLIAKGSRRGKAASELPEGPVKVNAVVHKGGYVIPPKHLKKKRIGIRGRMREVERQIEDSFLRRSARISR